MSNLIPRNYNTITFVFREDGYINMTKAALAFGKRMQHFFDNEETQTYIEALSNNRNPGDKELVQVQRGRGSSQRMYVE